MAVGNEFTDHERKLMALAWQCFDTKPKVDSLHLSNTGLLLTIPSQVDYKKLAGLAGMTNPVSASNAWAKICKKLMAQGGAGDADGGTPAATPKVARGKKRSKADDAKEDEDAEEDEESPTKKTKPVAKGKTGAKVKVEQNGSASPEKEDGEEPDFML